MSVIKKKKIKFEIKKVMYIIFTIHVLEKGYQI